MTLLEFAQSIPDFRVDRTKRHSAEVITYIALAAVICGAQTWNDIEFFGRCKINYFRRVFPFLKDIPSHDTFNRFFSLIKPEVLEKRFRQWVKSLCKKYKGVIAIDGKTNKNALYTEEQKNCRGTCCRAGSPSHRLHIVSAWATSNHISLGQIRTAEKSNEITAIPELLETLDIEGCIITIDAMGCQKAIAEKIIEKKADYVLAVKKNHEKLYESLEQFFPLWGAEKLQKRDYWETHETNRGRIETRKCYVCNNKYWLTGFKEWKDIRSFACIETERTVATESGLYKGKEKRYYISSLKMNAKEIYHAIREHWSVENNLHWQLDVTFGEDNDRKKNNAAMNFSLISKMALTLLKNDTTKKNSIQAKRKGAGWSDNYLHQLLTQNIKF